MAGKGKNVRESFLCEKQVDLAVSALLKYVNESQSKKPTLMAEDQSLWLIMALKKTPAPDKKPRRIPLSLSLLPDNTEVCLISKRESKLTKELLRSAGVTSVTKVISFMKLKKNYKSYEAKRQLASLYDVFICDDNIYHLLPNVLGKVFFAKKKFPIPVSLKKKDLRGEIDKVLTSTYISLGHGPCSAIKVGHTGQTRDDVVANVLEATQGIAKIVPRGWNNIKSLNIKTSDSISLPIHNSMPERPIALDSETVADKQVKKKGKEGRKEKKREVEMEEIASDAEEEDE